MGDPLSVLTWHVHGSYLDYLARSGHDFLVPVLPGRPPRFGGRPDDAPWPDNVREVPAEQVRDMDFDAILYQHHDNWLEDRMRWLSNRQLQRIPQAYLEHDPPRQNPTDTCHPVDDPNVPIVHVTHFNRLMWDCGRSPTIVIEHGVTVPDDVAWTGELPRGIAVVNNISARGRRLGADVFDQVREQVPIELYGMNSELAGGAGELAHEQVIREMARHRFFFNPIRYTSLGLAVCESLMTGTPVVGLATTEMSVAIESGVNGFVHTDAERLVDACEQLIEDRELAAHLSEGAREMARERYGIERFAAEWDGFLRELAS